MKEIILRHKATAIGCLILLSAFILLAIFIIAWFLPGLPGTKRTPHEIMLGDLIRGQETALNPGWTFIPRDTLTSDSDVTHGLWVYEALFARNGSPYAAWLRIHTFGSPSLAKRWFPPAPYDDLEGDGNLPEGWSYVPPHADQFVIDCTSEEVPASCTVYTVYREYSLVYTAGEAGSMTLEDLQYWLEATDQFMADFLESTSLVRGRRSIPTLSELGIRLGN